MRVAPATLLLSALGAAPALAVDLPLGIQLHGAVDVYADVNFNGPADHSNWIPGVGTTAKRANEASVNLVSVELVKDPEPVGFHLWLAAGTGADVVHLGELVGPSAGPDVWRYVQQASVAAKVPVGRGLVIEGGIYPSHIGFEGLASQGNWTYTRGWMGELSPYYQTGIKLSYAFDDSWSAQLHVLNGWQRIGDNNNGKAIGTQVAWKAGPSTLTFNTFFGPELDNDNGHWRFFGDIVWVLALNASMQLAVTADAGLQQRPNIDAATWHAAGVYVRHQFSPKWATSVRGEYYRDSDGYITGVAQTLVEGTLTLECRPWEILILKLEGRYDHSTASVFNTSTVLPDGTPSTAKDQVLVVLGAVAAF
ncbi:MAG: porin [Myxococcaceae bacterium]|nr:MAG: porin [Myxococcaceae bacterium]